MQTTPRHRVPAVVLHIPHASIDVPLDLRASLLLDDEALALELLRMTDHYTDELFALGPADGIIVDFPVSRLVLDPERFEHDEQDRMSARGMGVVYTHTSQGTPLRNEPSAAEREALLARFYRPHHARLTKRVNESLAACGSCLVIDCHSFPSRALPYELDGAGVRPDICIGTDSYHTPLSLVERARSMFEHAGFTVAIDTPFAGALVPAAHYRRDQRVSALMIEVNRGRYMNEETGERLSDFAEVGERIRAATRALLRPIPLLQDR